MCGICGFFYRDADRPISRDRLEVMTDALAHRGPDDRGSFVAAGGALGHRRLTIVDLTTAGRQPMLTADQRAVISFNGEIYNSRELAAQHLSDHTFRSTSDTEVLLELMRRQGVGAIERLNGMFAFAYWDLDARKVTFVRDPVGQKPFIYYFDGRSFVFGSELSSVALHPDVPLELDRRALGKYLVYEGYPHPYTALEGVKKLPPGHYLTLDLARWQLTEGRYWLSKPVASAAISEREALERFDATLRAAIERHYRSDVPVGIFLSAGLDSNTIVRAAVELKGRDAVQTFTIRHAEKSFDEADEAEQTARYYGVHHRERTLSESEVSSNVVELVSQLDEPLADPGYLSISQVIRFAKEHVTVTLGGDGGDELFAGYAPFRALGAYRVMHALLGERPARALERLASLPPASHEYMNTVFKAQRFLRGVRAAPAEVLFRWMGAFTPEQIAALLPGLDGRYVYEDLHPEYERLNERDLVTVLLHLFQQFYLPVSICSHSDKASMAVAQELRSPLLDVEMIRLANSLPSDLKYRRGVTKYLLRRYHEQGRSPPGVARRTKRGFTVPLARWLTTALAPWAEERLEQPGPFDAQHLRRLWDEHQSRRANHAKALWTVLVFQHWHDQTFSTWKVRRR